MLEIARQLAGDAGDTLNLANGEVLVLSVL